jgi:hypothetical protein
LVPHSKETEKELKNGFFRYQPIWTFVFKNVVGGVSWKKALYNQSINPPMILNAYKETHIED